MGRVYTRKELIAELAAASGNLREVSSSGDERRFTDDRVFCYAVAFLWLRLAEPACQLVTRRLVGDRSALAWEGMCGIRNRLAHEREQDIDFVKLWVDIPSMLDRTDVEVDRLLAAG